MKEYEQSEIAKEIENPSIPVARWGVKDELGGF